MRCYGPKPRAFMEMVPSGLLPVMELNGRVIIESDAIMAALEVRHLIRSGVLNMPSIQARWDGQ
jgi:glutathione S-transferase